MEVGIVADSRLMVPMTRDWPEMNENNSNQLAQICSHSPQNVSYLPLLETLNEKIGTSANFTFFFRLGKAAHNGATFS